MKKLVALLLAAVMMAACFAGCTAEPAQPASGGGVELDGIGDMPIKVSRCCRPIPGDPIIGFITTGSGLSWRNGDSAASM